MHLVSPFSKKINVFLSAAENDDTTSYSESPTSTINKLRQLPIAGDFFDDVPSSPESSYYSSKSTASSSSTLDTFLLDDKKLETVVTCEPPIPPRRSSMPILHSTNDVVPPPLPVNAKKITDAYSKRPSKSKLDESWSSIFGLNEKVKLGKSLGAKKSEQNQILKVTENGQVVLLYEMIEGKFQVVAGTPERLFEKLADETKQDAHYVDTFIIYHSNFISSSVFLDQLIHRFYLTPSPGEHDYFMKWQVSIQKKVLDVVDRWITIQYQDFKASVNLLKQLKKFLFHNDIMLLNHFKQQVEKIQQNLKSQFFQFSTHPVTSIVYSPPPSPTFNFHIPFVQPHFIPPVHIPSSPRRHGLFNLSPVDTVSTMSCFSAYTPSLSIDSKLIARYLTLADYYLFKAILSRGLLNNKHQSEHNYIDLMTKRSNMLSHWVFHELCNQTYIKAKRNLSKKFIEIAKMCLDLNNYHTCMVITMGLTSVPQFKQVWESLSSRDMNTFTSLQKLLDVSMNMRYYRQKIQFYKSPCVPFLPVVLKDQTFFKENATFLQSDPSLVNFAKFRSIRQFVDKTKDMTSETYWFASELTHYPFFPLSCNKEDGGYDHNLDPIADWVEHRLNKVQACYLQCDSFK